MIQAVLSQYTQVIPQADGFAINCPWCAEDNHKKMIYFYKSGITICFRCRDRKDRKWKNSWVALQDILKKLGVDQRKILSFNGDMNFVGNNVITKINTYYNNDIVKAEKSDTAKEFIRNRHLDINKVGEYLYTSEKGPMVGRIGWKLFPSGMQFRSLDKKEYKIYNPSHNNAIFCPDPISKVNDLYIVEGALDALMLHQYGYSAIGTLGTNPSPVIKQVLAYKQPNSIFIWMDNDAAGHDGEKKLSKYLASGEQELYSIAWKHEPGDIESENEVHDAIRTAEPVDLEKLYA